MLRPAAVRRAWIYPVWIALCAIAFEATSGLEDPSRRRDRILSDVAGARAAAILRSDVRYRNYDVVHVAYAGRGEGGREARWVVLLDGRPHDPEHARVVELRASDGALIGIREPE